MVSGSIKFLFGKCWMEEPFEPIGVGLSGLGGFHSRPLSNYTLAHTHTVI